MRRKYEKAMLKLNKTSLIKILATLLLLFISIKFDKIPALIPMLLIFLLIFFNLELFFTSRNYQHIYAYLTGNKKFEYERLKITREELIELLKEGIPADTYISYNKQIHTIESKNNKYFFLDFDEYKSLEDILNARISNIKISDIEEFELLSYNGLNPDIINKK